MRLSLAMMKFAFGTVVAVSAPFVLGVSKHGDESTTWTEKYGSQYDLLFSGPLSFSHLPYSKCLEQEESVFDVAILGIPFDTSVTYRPGLVQSQIHRPREGG